MTKVKIFINHSSQDKSTLEQQINEFLQSDEFGELIDIKYTSCMAGSEGRYKIETSAMVIYNPQQAL